MPRILVVDDSDFDRRVVCGVLEQETEVEVAAAANGIEAIAELDGGNIDVVVTDLVMPEMDGLELVGQIREKHPRVPVIVVTSRGSEVVAVEALKRGAASYVPKKVVASRLVKTVHELLAITTVQRGHDRLIDCLQETTHQFALENDVILIDSLVVHLMGFVRQLDLCDAPERRCVSVALKEALANALYHGNLEIDPALRQCSEHEYAQAAWRSKRLSPYKDRRIHVTAQLSRHEALFTVRDEGKGFDVTNLPDPANPAHLGDSSARGIVLMRTFMDEVVYNTAGNEVTLVKRAAARATSRRAPARAAVSQAFRR
jgi:CheY-like chemotaxis protein